MRTSRGFTLAETLIALGISSLIAIALVSILSVTTSMRSAVADRIAERVAESRVRSIFNDALRDAARISVDGTTVSITPHDETLMLRGGDLIWRKRRPYGIPKNITIASNVKRFSPRIERGMRGAEAIIISLQTDKGTIEYSARYTRKP